MSEIPFVAVGNSELGDPLELRVGETIPCPQGCGSRHAIEDGKPNGVLQFYKCGLTTYLIGIHGRKVKKWAGE